MAFKISGKILKVMAGASLLGLVLAGCSSSSSEPEEKLQALGGNCDFVLRYLDQAITALNGRGHDTKTDEEILEVLASSGGLLSGYYSPEDLGGMANYKLVSGAGKNLLKTRIDFIAGEGFWLSDYESSFLDSYGKINALCGF
jgi:hypothetical protein